MLNINLKSSRLAYFFIAMTCFLYYYLGGARAVVLSAYIVAIFFVFNAPRLAKPDIWILSLTAFSVAYHLLMGANVTVLLFMLRLNFGFLVFYYFFRSIERPRIESLTIVLSLATVFEYLLIRMFPFLVEILPNYMDRTFVPENTYAITGGVHGFGANRTVTSVILLSLFVYLENVNAKRRFRYLPLIASLLCFSGTGATLTATYFTWKYRKKWVLGPIMALIAVILTNTGEFRWEKFTVDYFYFLYDLKYEQILSASRILGGNISNYLFGAGGFSFTSFSNEVIGYGASFGDFMMLDFFVKFGILGVIILGGVFLASANRLTFFPILILFVGTFHYHVIFSTSGQLVLGYLLAVGSGKFISQVKSMQQTHLVRRKAYVAPGN